MKVIQVMSKGNRVPGRGTSQCKGPGVEAWESLKGWNGWNLQTEVGDGAQGMGSSQTRQGL